MPRHSETKVLPYRAAQMFDLVADVARYPEFLPWTAAARIRSRAESATPIVVRRRPARRRTVRSTFHCA